MKKLHVLIIVRNHSDTVRLQAVVQEFNWIAKIVDLNQLSIATSAWHFDWVVAVDVPSDCPNLKEFLNYTDQCLAKKCFNLIHLQNQIINVSQDKLKKNWFDVSRLLRSIEYGDATSRFSVPKDLGNAMRSGYSRFQTPAQARQMAAFLSQLTADPENTYLGLWEFFINAIEHGNLALSHEDKKNLLSGQNIDEVISARLLDESHCNRYVRVSFDVDEDNVTFDIKDDGEGFDWKPFTVMKDEQLLDKNGRGIALTHTLSFDDITYMGSGNQVQCRINSCQND